MKKFLLTSVFAMMVMLCTAAEPYFRAAWISTVANIDFPTKEAIGNYEQQQKDMIAMLDAFQAMHLKSNHGVLGSQANKARLRHTTH